MKTLTKIMSIAASAAILVSCASGPTPEETAAKAETEAKAALDGEYAINTNESKLMWEGNMLKIGGVSLYGHTGTLEFQKGMVKTADGKITEGMLIVDMKTLTPTDENYKPEEGQGKADLVGHLASPDFFSVEEFPTASFKVTGMEEGKIMGEMTIRGITHPEVIENVTMDQMEGKISAKGTLTLDRQKYGVAFKAPYEDKVVSDDLDLQFILVADKGATM